MPMHAFKWITCSLLQRQSALPLGVQGLTEEQAVARFGDVDIYTSSFRPMRNTISGSPMRTFMKLVVDASSQKVVGCHMVGDDSAEIMQVRASSRCTMLNAETGTFCGMSGLVGLLRQRGARWATETTRGYCF